MIYHNIKPCNSFSKIGTFIFMIITCLLLSNCSIFQGDSSYDLERQINLQNAQREITSESQPEAKKTAEEYEARGDLYLIQNDFNRAYVQYVKGLGQSPDNRSLLHKQANLLLKKDRRIEAKNIYNKLLEQDKGDSLALQGLGRILFSQGAFKKAEEAFNQAIELNPDLGRSFEFIGLIHCSREEYQIAITFFQKALSLLPTDYTVTNNLAVTYYILKDYSKSVSLLKTIPEKLKGKKVYNNLALSYFKLGDHDTALVYFKRGSESDSIAYNNIGYEFLCTNNYIPAISAFELAIKLHPKYYPEAQTNLKVAKNALTKIGTTDK
ncbi:tetratricopeptide repeat protein [Desulfogranum mediterraneum]|uniref:tetratricopeptide repeat protein n=1 Tax=Desulfogranum mediterraneum TaxID=160661 RepID=UPI0003FD1316|nr:tetratricopeptide repeat protein [Desulfogranum mediterraneum]